ncbi:MAG TPA: hypothetical protein VJT80_07105 [Steroidobacteraceae bacterium]|nr:hypothetical protein [Steroidobacteraceae bacterium]
MTTTPAVRHLQQLDELITKVVREADVIRDYVQLRFHNDVVLTLHNVVELDGQRLTNSASGRILLASVVGRMVNDVARAADRIVLNFRDGPTLTMSLQSPASSTAEALQLSARPAAAEPLYSAD